MNLDPFHPKLYIPAINVFKVNDSIQDNKMGIPDYNLIRKDRERSRGCVALYIQDNIP